MIKRFENFLSLFHIFNTLEYMLYVRCTYYQPYYQNFRNLSTLKTNQLLFWKCLILPPCFLWFRIIEPHDAHQWRWFSRRENKYLCTSICKHLKSYLYVTLTATWAQSVGVLKHQMRRKYPLICSHSQYLHGYFPLDYTDLMTFEVMTTYYMQINLPYVRKIDFSWWLNVTVFPCG